MTQTEQPEIQELDARTVERIAAGEVVERPASVVKELVENSIDAGASRVSVAVEAGGTERIRVADDGVGMSEQDLSRAVEKHSTSKIGDINDLESGVATLGFRGEALHAIGAVSRLTVTSRPRGGDRGAELTVEGSEVTDVSPAGCPEGTTVEVRDLFYNVPARRKYLKQESTEFTHVNRVVTSYALANPGVAVTLEHGGRETFSTTGQGNLRETVLSVYGREVAEGMVELRRGELPDGPLDSIDGLVSDPEVNRATREYLSTYVNGRYVTSGPVREAVVDAYGKQLAGDRYPFAVLFLEVDPATVDVNVHPRKMRIRYRNSEGVKRQVRTAVEDALQEEGVLRSSAPRGRSAPDQATIEPSSVSGESDESPTDDTGGATTDDTGGATTDDTGGATTDDTGGATTDDASGATTDDTITTDAGTDGTPTSDDVTSRPSPNTDTSRSLSTSDSTQSSSPHPRPSRSTAASEAKTQTTLHGEDAHPPTEYETLPDLRVLGQLHDTYVIAEADDGLLLIDQHAADERINYERLRDRFEGDTTTQALADPVEIELTSGEAAVFDAYKGALARLGFHADRVDDRMIRVSTVPAVVAEASGPKLIRDVLAEVVEDESTAERTVEAVADELLADMACHPSITGNTSLTEGSVVDLLSALDDCENPWACPHGRPVLIHLDSEEIEDRFERDYPGK